MGKGPATGAAPKGPVSRVDPYVGLQLGGEGEHLGTDGTDETPFARLVYSSYGRTLRDHCAEDHLEKVREYSEFNWPWPGLGCQENILDGGGGIFSPSKFPLCKNRFSFDEVYQPSQCWRWE